MNWCSRAEEFREKRTRRLNSSLTSHLLVSMSQLTASSAESDTSISLRRWRQRDRPILAYGLMLLAAVSLVLNYFIKFPTLPDEAAVSFRLYRDKRLPLEIETNDARKLAWYFEASAVPFPAEILDPAAYTLQGGRVHRVLNRRTSWTAYQGPENSQFVLQAYRGGIEELPAATEIRWKGGRSFHIYLRQGTTIVFWQEKDLCWALISDVDPEEAIRLAHASAS